MNAASAGRQGDCHVEAVWCSCLFGGLALPAIYTDAKTVRKTHVMFAQSVLSEPLPQWLTFIARAAATQWSPDGSQ
jgi:hypothetical protein